LARLSERRQGNRLKCKQIELISVAGDITDSPLLWTWPRGAQPRDGMRLHGYLLHNKSLAVIVA